MHRLDLNLQARVGLDEQAAPATTHLEEQAVAEALAIEGATLDHQAATHAAQRRVDPQILRKLRGADDALLELGEAAAVERGQVVW